MKKKIARFLSLALGTAMVMSTVACGNPFVETEREIDETKSQLYVSTRDAGIGVEWFKKLARGFEEKYANVPFEEGKMGVQVLENADRNNTGSGQLGTIARSDYSVLMCEAMQYSSYMGGDLLYDISDLIEEKLEDGSTILSKLDEYQIDYLTGYNGNYYALPWLAGFCGVTYNANLFELYDEETNPNGRGFYLADANGLKPATTSSYTGKAYTGRGFITANNSKKAPGPDGKYNTFDDGLPSSYEEFFYVCDYMSKKGCNPFIYAGASSHYVKYLMEGLCMAWSGAEEMSWNFSFDSEEDAANIITSFENGEPVVTPTQITPETGYLMSQQESFYYAAKFFDHLYENEATYFAEETFSGVCGNLDAQEYFIESELNADYKPIGMLIEGNYWYGEAATAFKASVDFYGEEVAGNRNFRWMSLPGQETGTVNEGEGRTTAIADGLSCYFVVNNNIKGNSVKEELASKFIKYCYEDANLQMFTQTCGMPVAVDYDLTPEQYNSIDTYKQSCWDVFKAAVDANEYLPPVAGNKTYMDNYMQFGYSTQTNFFDSKIAGTLRTEMRTLFKSYTAEEYFAGRAISASDWISKYYING